MLSFESLAVVGEGADLSSSHEHWAFLAEAEGELRCLGVRRVRDLVLSLRETMKEGERDLVEEVVPRIDFFLPEMAEAPRISSLAPPPPLLVSSVALVVVEGQGLQGSNSHAVFRGEAVLLHWQTFQLRPKGVVHGTLDAEGREFVQVLKAVTPAAQALKVLGGCLHGSAEKVEGQVEGLSSTQLCCRYDQG